MKSFSIAVIAFLCACTAKPERNQDNGPVTRQRIVKAKKEAMESNYRYEIDPFSKDVLKKRMHLETAYYLVYTDGSYEQVDVGRYSVVEVGDTVTQTIYY